MSNISSVEKELTKWRKSKKGCRGGKPTPEYIRKQAIELLRDYSPLEIQKRLGITINMLKTWQEENISEPIFINLPLEPGIKKMIPAPEKMSSFALKISNGSWSLEGTLSLKDWHNAIRLLEGVR